MHRHCQLSNLSFSHPQLPLNRREVAAPGIQGQEQEQVELHAHLVRQQRQGEGHLPAAEASLGLSGIQSMLQPTMAPSSFPESISPAPSSGRLPLLQAGPGLLGTVVWHVWGLGERVCPMKWVPRPHLGSMGLEDKPRLPGRAAKHSVVSNAVP